MVTWNPLFLFRIIVYNRCDRTNRTIGVIDVETMTANEAKTQFGELLLKAQREPVQICRNGKPVAVMISHEEYQLEEERKMQYVREHVERGIQDLREGRVHDGKEFFRNLLARKYD